MSNDQPHLPDTHDIAAMGVDLGRRLADLRRANGLTQHQLGKLIGYARGTLSAVECGRYDQARRFWQQCDDVLHADGQLVGRYDEIKVHRARAREQQARTVAAGRDARLAEWRQTDQHGTDPAHESPALHPEVAPTDIHIWFTSAEGVTHCLVIPRTRISRETLVETLVKVLGL